MAMGQVGPLTMSLLLTQNLEANRVHNNEVLKNSPNRRFLPHFCRAGAARLQRHLMAKGNSAAALALLSGMGEKSGKKGKNKEVKTVFNTLQTQQRCRSTLKNCYTYQRYYVCVHT